MQHPRLTRHPWFVAIALGLIAEALFAFRVATPHKLMFDEVHYVPAARTLMAFSHPANIEHPLLAKTIIAAGIALFGDDSFGWRIFSTLAASAVVMGVFAITFQLTHRMRPAIVASVLTLADFTVFIQARIAMLDGFMAAFVVVGMACLIWSATAAEGRAMGRLVLTGMLLGLGIGCKWVALPFLGYAGLAVIAVRLIDTRRRGADWEAALYASGQPHWRGVPTFNALIALGVPAVLVYLATFWPAFFYAQEPLTLAKLLPFQKVMYAEQTQVLPPHPYQSSWWTWPFDIRPIWYLYEPVDGAQRGVIMLGNPAILWGGLIAVAGCLWAWARDRAGAAGIAALLWIGAFAMWVVIPKSLGFFYYYYVASIFLSVAIAVAFDHFRWLRARQWDDYFTILSVGLFVYFYPIIAAVPLAGPQSFHRWMWLPTWP